MIQDENTPLIITKKYLCHRFGIGYNTGRSCRRMRKLLFDDDLLGKLRLSEDAWKSRTEFTRSESIIICEHLKI